MTENSSTLFKFTPEAFIWLSDNIEKNAELYRDPDADFDGLLKNNGIEEYREPTEVTIKNSISLNPPDQNNSRRHLADHQALDFYDSFDGMTPYTASDPEVLAYINHFYLHKYGIMRWPLWGGSTLVSNIQKHWLTRSNQKLDMYKSNISGRTWWLAYVAYSTADASNGAFDASEALRTFTDDPEYYHRMMEFKVLRNPSIGAECVRSLLNESKGVNRLGFRDICKEINREAGARLVDSLLQPEIRNLMTRASDRVMRRPEFVTDRRNMRGVEPYKVLSLGAGTQSTVMALMAEEGFGGLEKPDIAIFADTHWEPPHVYEHLDWLEKQLSYDVLRVSAGDIRKNILDGITPDGNNFLDMPVFLINPDGTKSVAARQCTNHYKIIPIHKKLREILKLEPGRRAPKDVQVEMWIGISADEAGRIKPSRDEWITNRYPIIEMELTRAQLYTWFTERYPDRNLPRSACVGCPYHTDMEWKWLKENDPDSFNDAVFIDRAIRDIPHIRGSLKGTGYLHKTRKSLDNVEFTDVESYDDFMATECEGLCGV